MYYNVFDLPDSPLVANFDYISKLFRFSTKQKDLKGIAFFIFNQLNLKARVILF
jgi:hypothetical protein